MDPLPLPLDEQAGWGLQSETVKFLKKPWFLLMLAGLPILSYAATIWYYALDVPFLDDYDAVLHFLNRYEASGTFAERIGLIFDQHNEHRIAFTRLVSLAHVRLLGNVSFRSLILIGNLMILGILIVAFLVCRDQFDQYLWYFVPIPYLLFHCQLARNALWGMSCIQHFGVCMFAVLSLYLLSKPNWRCFSFAVVAGMFATFTSGSGFLVFMAGAIYLLQQRRFGLQLSIWSGAMVIAVVSYFTGYQPNPNHPAISDAVLVHPGLTITHFFSVIGSDFRLHDKYGNQIACLAGIVMIALVVFLILGKHYKKQPHLFAMLLFILAASAITSMSRAGFGIPQAFSSRYKMNSSLTVILLYLVLMQLVNPRIREKLLLPILIGAMVFNIVSFRRHLPEIIEAQHRLSFGALSPAYPDQGTAERVLAAAAANGHYSFPEDVHLRLLSPVVDRDIVPPTTNVTHDFVVSEKSGYFFVERGWAFMNGRRSRESEVFLAFVSPARNYLFRANGCYRPFWMPRFKQDGLSVDHSGFFALTPSSELATGNYRIGVLIQNGDDVGFAYTGQSVVVDSEQHP